MSVYLGCQTEKGNGVYHHLCSWRSLPMIPDHPAYALRLVNKSPFKIHQAVYKLLLLCCISMCYLFKGGDSISPYSPKSPRASLLIFKVPGINPADHRICKFMLLWFSKMAIHLPCVFPCAWDAWCEGLFLFSWDSPMDPFSSWPCLCLFYPFWCGQFSTFGYEQSVLPDFGSFSE